MQVNTRARAAVACWPLEASKALFRKVEQTGNLTPLLKTETDDFLPEWYLNSVFIPYHLDF